MSMSNMGTPSISHNIILIVGDEINQKVVSTLQRINQEESDDKPLTPQ